MMPRDKVLKKLAEGLVRSGFQGRGRRFTRVWPELAWLFQLESIPRTARVGIYVGICPVELAPNGWPARANDCPIILHPEGGGEPFGLDHWEAWQALDTASELEDAVRLATLDEIVRSVAEVAERVTTIGELRRLAADGQLRGFVHRDARALLDGDDATP